MIIPVKNLCTWCRPWTGRGDHGYGEYIQFE